MLTKQHFQVIAATIRESLPSAFDELYWNMADTTYREQVANAFAEMLSRFNPQFNQQTFLTACGIEHGSPIRDNNLVEVMGRHIPKDQL
jgi:hypothetical protein